MCGIAGVFSPGKGPPSSNLLRRMLHLLRHRGPDEFGVFLDASIGLAHARLSIIDLSTGQQPIQNEDGSLWIVFNGEIFNYIELRKDLISRGHRFRTKSDTEVILHLYEEKKGGALDELNGQFAFAIWDNNRKELFLARDRSPGLQAEIASSNPADRVIELFGDLDRARHLDPLTWSQEIEIKTLLPSYLLSSQGDRMLMGNSVEGRFPFLDHRVVEFALSIPPQIRMKGITEKYILRRGMGDILPKEIGKMEKQPYRAPDARCFIENDAEGVAEAMLSPECIARNGYIDPKYTEMLVTKCRRNPQVGFKDNMAFIGILSTQLIDHMFLRDFHAREEISPDRVRLVTPQGQNGRITQ